MNGMGGEFDTLSPFEKVFQILTTIGGRPGALGELKDAETARKLRRFQLEDLMRTREEGERPASLPIFTQKEMPSAGLEHLPSGEPPSYDFPTAYRKEMGVEQIPIPGYKMRDIGKVDLGDLYKSFTGQKKSYAINKEGQTMTYTPGESLPPGYTPIEHQFKGESDEAIQHVSNPWQDEVGNLYVTKTFKSGRTVHEPVMQPGMGPTVEPTPLPVTPETKFKTKEGTVLSEKKAGLKQLKGKQTPKLPLHRDYADEKTGITWRQEYEDDGKTRKGVPYKVRVPAPKQTKAQIDDLFQRYNIRRIEAPTDPARIEMINQLKEMGVEAPLHLPELDREEFEKYISTGKMPEKKAEDVAYQKSLNDAQEAIKLGADKGKVNERFKQKWGKDLP